LSFIFSSKYVYFCMFYSNFRKNVIFLWNPQTPEEVGFRLFFRRNIEYISENKKIVVFHENSAWYWCMFYENHSKKYVNAIFTSYLAWLNMCPVYLNLPCIPIPPHCHRQRLFRMIYWELVIIIILYLEGTKVYSYPSSRSSGHINDF